MRSRTSILRACFFGFILLFTGLASGVAPAGASRPGNDVRLERFDLLTASSGWILLDGQLFWTSDAGRTWADISPALPSGAQIQAVDFLDANNGWLLSTLASSDGYLTYQLAHTTDGGAAWTIRALPLFDAGEAASSAEQAGMDWLDAQTGWISVKQSSGSNFSLGTLFKTSDGGRSWQRFTLPAAGQVAFSDAQAGWAVGGPAGDQLFQTQDGGGTWQDLRPHDLPADRPVTVYMPFDSGNDGLLVLQQSGPESIFRVYSLSASSNEWSLLDRVTLDAQPGVIPLSILDAKDLVAVIPGTRSILRLSDGRLDRIDNQDGLSASIVDLDMVTLEAGWAKSVTADCVRASGPEPEAGSVSCSHATRLLQTADGGRTWRPVDLPSARSDTRAPSWSDGTRSFTESAVRGPDNTEVLAGQAFDKCEIPTLAQLQTWSENGPYAALNLYIGGSSRACGNSALSLSFLRQVHQQGWRFIPTWVGPQAPCTSYRSRFSSDVTTAYNQGIDEANLAVERLSQLGLTNLDKTGSVVYYDIENYGTDANCRSAVNAFMNGWVTQLHARGNTAGVYGSTLCNTGLSDFRTIANVPDVIWPARWYHSYGSGYYDPTADVWDLGSCVPNTVWANHQRVRQYEGGHDETWGELTLNIDSNALDGVVAIPNTLPIVSSIQRLDATPTSAATVSFTVTFSEPVSAVDPNDFILSTSGDIHDQSIEQVTGSNESYVVRVNTGSGSGTLRLDVPATATITDVSGNGLTGLPFNTGESYTVEKIPGAGIYDDSAHYWIYSGTWTTYSGTTPYNSTLHYSNVAGSEAQFTFDGAKFVLTYVRANNRGRIDVYVDGTKIDTINAYSPTTVWQATWSSPALAPGLHTVRFVHAGNGAYIDIDAIQIRTVLDTIAPEAIDDLSAVSGSSTGTVTLSWTAPGDDNAAGTAAGYLVRYSSSAITTETAWNAATPVTTSVPTPAAAGSAQTMTVSALTPGATYFFAVRAQDEEPNTGGLSNSPSAMAQSPTAAPAGTYDDVDGSWTYSGTWTSYTGTGPLDGTVHYSNRAGSEARLSFNGNRFILTYVRASNRGLIDVYVDGVKIGTINAKATTTAWQQTWTSPVLSQGSHVVRFVHAGGGTYIDIDAIRVQAPAESIAPAAIGDLTASGTTTPGVVQLHWTAPGDDGVSGIASAYLVRFSSSLIDGEPAWNAANPVVIDVPAPALAGTEQSMTVRGLVPGATYYVAVRAQDDEGNLGGLSNTASAVTQDALPLAAGTYNDTDGNWIYSGGWTAYTGSGPVGNDWHTASTAGSTAQISFNGSRFTFTYVKASNRGLIDVYVDGIRIETINAYSSSLTWRQTWTSPSFMTGMHTALFVHAGGGTYVDVDAIQVLEPPPPGSAGTYDDNDAAWAYGVGWIAYSGAGPLNNTSHYCNIPGRQAWLTFNGTGFTFTYVKASNRGSIEVYVDGNKVGTINAYSSTLVWQATWTSPTFAPGLHTVVFKHAGGGTYIDVDAITIIP